MKKLHVLAGVLVMVVFCFAALSWAQEASVFDETNGFLIRAYIVNSNVTDPISGQFCSASTGQYCLYLGVWDKSGNLIPAANLSGLQGANPLQVHNNATSDDLSISFDNYTGTTYLFCTDGSLMLMPYTITKAGQTTYTISGQVTTGSGGLSGVTMTLGGSGSGTTPTNTSGNYSFSGLSAGSYTVTPSLSGYTFTPTSWSGSISANTAVNFTASASGGGNVVSITKLIPENASGIPLSGINNGQQFNVVIQVQNTSTSSSGSFTVKVYFSADKIAGNAGDYLLCAWPVSGLSPGQTMSYTCNNVYFSGFGAHASYYVVAQAFNGTTAVSAVTTATSMIFVSK